MTSIRQSLRVSINDLFEKNTDYKYPEQAINQAESLKSLSSDLYTDNIRFIYELIQNADDAQAKNVVLTILDNKYLIIAHNGKPFDEKDLQGLCGVNNGIKKKDLDKTGYKGLGFKAVFGKSDKVIIYSDGEYFRFDSSYQIKWNIQWGTNNQQAWERENDRQFIYPWQINPIWTNENEVPYLITSFLRFRQTQIHVATIILLNNVDEICSAIDQLKQQPYMFLFLRNISKMVFIVQKSTDTISIDRDSNYGLKKVFFNENMVSQWIIRRFELDVPDDVRDKLAKDSKAPEKLRFIRKAEMFFAAKYKDGGIIEKLHDKESHLFCYLPTKIFDYFFPIIINANFLINANREQLHTDSAWNQWLFGQIGMKLFEWIKELVVNDQFYYQAYRLLPAKLNLTNNNLSNQFNKAFEWSIQNCRFIRNRKKELLKANEVIMDSTSMSEQSSFINIDSMRQYVVDQYKGCAVHPFIDYDWNLWQIGVRNFTWKDCIQMFKSDQFLKTYSVEANKQMITYFYSICPNLEKANEMKIPIEEIPFLLDQNNCLQSIENIYFPAETVGDSGTSDSDDLYVNKIIFDWLNKYPQAILKKWLKDLGVDERTDLTYLRKTIIPNASTYTTQENAIKTIRMLFILFQKNHIDKKELNQLKNLKLLTTRKTLIPAEQCFFSKIYDPRLLIERFLIDTEDKFLSPDYLTNDVPEWHRFFTAMGVRDELYLINYKEKINIRDATQLYGFSEKYLTRPSPNGRRPADGYSGLKTIIFLENTRDNYEFAQVFWSYVIEKMHPSDLLQYSVRVYWRSSYGTEISDSGYIEWFVKHIQCIPTTLKNCQISVNTFIDTDEIKKLCGTYLPVIDIPSQQNLSNWISFFDFKTKFSINDYFQLLDDIYEDDANLGTNQDRIQDIYSHLLNDSISWSIDEQNLISITSKTVYLLTENNQWKLASDLYLYVDGSRTNSHLNDLIPCLKLNLKNKNHRNLLKFAELFNIKQIKMNDLQLVYEGSDDAEEFREKLIEISPYLKRWLKYFSVSPVIISSIDRILQQEIRFIESDCLKLYYSKNFIQETNAYFDAVHQQFYLTRPWYSETTFIDLPKKLCQLLKIEGFEEDLRFLIKGEKEEILKRFTKLSIVIPAPKDRIQLEPIPRSDLQSRVNLFDEFMSDQDEQTSDEEEVKNYTRESDYAEVYTKRGDSPNDQHLTLLSKKRKRHRSSTSINSVDKMFNHLNLIDLSTISSSNSASIKTSFNRNRSGGNGEMDMRTGLTGEQLVYGYLLNKYHHQLDSVPIEWLNKNGETSLPYDILLTENGITHYIEVKATRSNNQHTFFLSMNQMKAILQHGDNYHIYRVYLKQEKLVILNDIESLLKDRNQLALLLTMNPKSLDQAIFTNE